jgi:hypothetical protein
MSKVTIAQLADQVAALTAVVSSLATIVAQAPVSEPVKETTKPTGFMGAKNFEAKFTYQCGKARALAKNKGYAATVAAVPKNGEWQVWYMASSRKVPAGGTALVTFQPDGATTTHVNLGGLKLS